MNPYHSDFEDQTPFLYEDEKKKKFDFSELPETPLMLVPYLHYRDQEWQGSKAALEYLRKVYKSTDDPTEKRWVEKMGKILKGEQEESIKPATKEQANRWLGLMIKDKSGQVLDAQRQGDQDMAEEYQSQERALEELRDNIGDDKWAVINIDEKNAPLNACISETEQSLAFYNEQKRRPQAEEAQKKLIALQRIKALIEKNQN